MACSCKDNKTCVCPPKECACSQPKEVCDCVDTKKCSCPEGKCQCKKHVCSCKAAGKECQCPEGECKC